MTVEGIPFEHQAPVSSLTVLAVTRHLSDVPSLLLSFPSKAAATAKVIDERWPEVEARLVKTWTEEIEDCHKRLNALNKVLAKLEADPEKVQAEVLARLLQLAEKVEEAL